MRPVSTHCMILRTNPVEHEINFNILKNGEGNLMLLVHARMGGVTNSKIVYDGGQKALLYRTEQDVVSLDFIHPAIRGDLKKKKEVLVVEVNDGAVVREYMASVQAVKTLPL